MNKQGRPCFRLQKIYNDGTDEQPEMFTVGNLDGGWRMGRRGFLFASAAGLAAGAGLPSYIKEAGADEGPVQAGCAKGVSAHRQGVESVVFSPDGRLLASAGQDGTVKLWEMPLGRLVKTFWGHKKLVAAVCFDPTGNKLASCSSDKNIIVWDTQAKKQLQQYTAGEIVRSAAFSPDGSRLVSADLEGIKVWPSPRADTGNVINHPTGIFSMTPDGKHLAVATKAGKVEIFDATSFESTGEFGLGFFKKLLGAKSRISSLTFSPDGRTLALTRKGNVELWDWASEEMIGEFEGAPSERLESGPYYRAAFSPSGKWLAAGVCQESNIDTFYALDIWDVAGRRLHKTLIRGMEKRNAGYIGFGASFAFNPDETLLAAGFPDGTIRLWDARTWEHLTCLFDPITAPEDIQAVQYTLKTQTGRLITYTKPVGSTMPAAAVCTCDSVAGSYRPATGGGVTCACDRVCTCVPVK